MKPSNKKIDIMSLQRIEHALHNNPDDVMGLIRRFGVDNFPVKDSYTFGVGASSAINAFEYAGKTKEARMLVDHLLNDTKHRVNSEFIRVLLLGAFGHHHLDLGMYISQKMHILFPANDPEVGTRMNALAASAISNPDIDWSVMPPSMLNDLLPDKKFIFKFQLNRKDGNLSLFEHLLDHHNIPQDFGVTAVITAMCSPEVKWVSLMPKILSLTQPTLNDALQVLWEDHHDIDLGINERNILQGIKRGNFTYLVNSLFEWLPEDYDQKYHSLVEGFTHETNEQGAPHLHARFIKHQLLQQTPVDKNSKQKSKI